MTLLGSGQESYPLFALETNTGFDCEPVPVMQEDLRRAAEMFGVAARSAAVVRKRNAHSTLYWIRGAQVGLMLRRVAREQMRKAEQQCSVAAAVGDDLLLVPTLSSEGRFAWASRSYAWTAYQRIDGCLFTGFNCDVRIVIDAALRLQSALRSLASPSDGSRWPALPRVEHRAGDWPAAFAGLVDGRRDPALPISDETYALLGHNRRLVGDCIASAMALAPTVPTLTHNDLQHANVLIEEGKPRFIDLEDLCFESPEIAIAHAVFKLVRHSVFTGARTLKEARREIIPGILGSLAAADWKPCDAADLLAYGAYRIISDVAEILRVGGDDLYDLEKRIHNLFELCELLEYGPAAQ